MKKITLFVLIVLSSNFALSQKLPYPIIFIHGLNSDSNVWIDEVNFLLSQGINFGGKIDYCLNYDGNNAIANKNTYPTPNADIALFTDYNTLSVGDYYFLNFDIDNQGRIRGESGFNDQLSNEAAIVKQGIALKYAIQMVLQKTGRDKIILMGHSMGGLCAREYLQNPVNWQADGQHHVAKLITTGTPHGGFSGIGLDPTIDFKSEAFRDLKSPYFVSGLSGVFLFGGTESNAVMNNNLLSNFYNVDVNCNGIVNENILGLNQKTLVSDVDYAYIIGNCVGCPTQGIFSGDGVVREDSANLSNFYPGLPLPKNEFHYTGSATIQIHSDLPHQIIQNMQGLDEPNEYNLSYGIYGNITYTGFITQQPVNGYIYDFDDYKFIVAANAQISVSVTNIYSGSLTCRIMDSTYTQIATTTISGSSNGMLSYALTPGLYYLEFVATASATSYMTPYTFSLSGTLGIDVPKSEETMLYPNPVTSKLLIKSKTVFDKVEVYNLLGQKLISTIEYSAGIDLSEFESGTYVIKMFSDGKVKTEQIIKQ